MVEATAADLLRANHASRAGPAGGPCRAEPSSFRPPPFRLPVVGWGGGGAVRGSGETELLDQAPPPHPDEIPQGRMTTGEAPRQAGVLEDAKLGTPSPSAGLIILASIPVRTSNSRGTSTSTSSV